METFAKSMIEKGFGSKKRLLLLNDEKLLRETFPSMTPGDLVAFTHGLKKVQQEGDFFS